MVGLAARIRHDRLDAIGARGLGSGFPFELVGRVVGHADPFSVHPQFHLDRRSRSLDGHAQRNDSADALAAAQPVDPHPDRCGGCPAEGRFRHEGREVG